MGYVLGILAGLSISGVVFMCYIFLRSGADSRNWEMEDEEQSEYLKKWNETRRQKIN